MWFLQNGKENSEFLKMLSRRLECLSRNGYFDVKCSSKEKTSGRKDGTVFEDILWYGDKDFNPKSSPTIGYSLCR
jgi:hypothetical protein